MSRHAERKPALPPGFDAAEIEYGPRQNGAEPDETAKAAVRVGEAPIRSEIPIAIGAVTDFASSLQTTGSSLRPSDALAMHRTALRQRLFRSRFSLESYEVQGDPASNGWIDMQVAPRGHMWCDKQPDQGALWGGWIELGEDFYRAITAAPVPVDMRALRA